MTEWRRRAAIEIRGRAVNFGSRREGWEGDEEKEIKTVCFLTSSAHIPPPSVCRVSPTPPPPSLEARLLISFTHFLMNLQTSLHYIYDSVFCVTFFIAYNLFVLFIRFRF